jgi:gamma-glutamylcyclotransferase (GGCT)/AIG2-like uncharacterized protein YtfP
MKRRRKQGPVQVFVYGTLMRGESRHGLLREHGLESVLLAESPGRLVDLGDFPAMLPHAGGAPTFVRGELVFCRDSAGLIRRLDEVEGSHGGGRDDNLFERRVVPVGMMDGHEREAWAYVYARPGQGSPTIVSGDWRVHRGARRRVLEALVRGHCGADELAVARALVRGYPMPPADFDEAVNEILPLAAALERGAFSERELAMASGKWAVEVEDVAAP